MHWLLLLLALLALGAAFKTTSVALAVLCLVVALGLTLAFVMGLLARRMAGRSRDESLMLDPDELRRLREQADARKLEPQRPPE